MMSTSPLETKYLNLILLKKFDEAIDFAKLHNIDIFCDDNYLMVKILNLDCVDILISLKSKDLLGNIRLINESSASLACHTVTSCSHKCLDWLIKENLVAPLTRVPSTLLCDLVLQLIVSKINALNNSLNKPFADEKIVLINDTTKKLVDCIFPPINQLSAPNMPIPLSIMEIIDKGIIPPYTWPNISVHQNHYTYNPEIKKEHVLPVIEAHLLHQNIKASPSILTGMFKV